MRREQKPLMVNGKTFPKNLVVLKAEDDVENNWDIKPCYYLMIVHGLMGFYPAVFNGTERMILCRDKELLEKLWRTLEPEKSKMDDELFYAHKTEPVCYPAKHHMGDEYSEPIQLLTEEEYELLMEPFRWAPGLIGAGMSKEGFQKMIDDSQKVKTPA